MTNCIPSHLVEKLKQAFVSGELSIAALYEAETSEARKSMLEKHIPSELATFLNLKFEEAMVSERRSALVDWLKEATTPKEQKAKEHANLLKKIKQLDSAGLMTLAATNGTITDLVSERLGVTVTADEIRAITEKSEKIEATKEEVKAAEASEAETKKYFERLTKAKIAHYGAIVEMDKYLNSLVPTHNLKVLTGQMGRGNMLLNVPPAVVNTVSNAVQGIMQAFERRLASLKLASTNNDFAAEYAKMCIKVFHETGYDMSRDYPEDFRLGEQVVHCEGPGIIRKVGRIQQKIVFKYMLGYSDVVSASIAAADSMNLQAAKIAEKEGLTGSAAKKRALQILKDASALMPSTKEGLLVREQSIADAEMATWTNKGFIAKAGVGFRDWLNNITGDLQLGYFNIPFVKTGANVIQFGLESTPIGTIEAFTKLPAALKAMNDKVNPNTKPMQDVIRLAVRSGMGTILSLILANLIPPDDFIGAYEALSPKQREEMGIQNGVYNAVKLGKKWVSLDFFGALGAGFVGMMYAKKYGKGVGDSAWKYMQGIGGQALQVPGLRDFSDMWDTLTDIITSKSAREGMTIAAKGTIDSVRSRLIPGIVNTIAQMTDNNIRQTDSKNLFDKTKATIPGLRQTLPAKINPVTGDEMETESALSVLFFGSRVKTATESKVIDEIVRLNQAGFPPAIGNPEKTSERVKALKQQISPEKYKEALQWYGKEYAKRASIKIETDYYKKADDEKKKDILNKVRDDVLDGFSLNGQTFPGMLQRFGYVKPPKNKGLKTNR
jgi:hypothetical protein